MSDEICTHLPWDSNFFGYSIARVAPSSLDSAAAANAIEWCKNEQIRLAYFLANDSVASWHAAIGVGFQPVDMRVEMALDRTAHRSLVELPDGMLLRAARQQDMDALLGIASSVHTDSRFFADENIDRDRARALYAEWLRRSVDGALADVVFVAELNGSAVSYITAKVAEGVGNIGLVGVGAAARGRGVGPAMVGRALDWFGGAGARDVTVVTQGRNTTAQRLYERCGFRTNSTRLWFHRWF